MFLDNMLYWGRLYYAHIPIRASTVTLSTVGIVWVSHNYRQQARWCGDSMVLPVTLKTLSVKSRVLWIATCLSVNTTYRCTRIDYGNLISMSGSIDFQSSTSRSAKPAACHQFPGQHTHTVVNLWPQISKVCLIVNLCVLYLLYGLSKNFWQYL